MRFQSASPDARAVVYAGIQADPLVARTARLLADATPAQLVMARAVMNGETTEPDRWRRMIPTVFRGSAAAASEAILVASLEVAERGEQARSQYRGAIVEELTQVLVGRRVPPTAVHRERRVLFDGVRAEIHPYDVTVELPERAEVYDCKWGARGINADVLNQLDDAQVHATAEGARVLVALVVFDARRSCEVRLVRSSAPRGQTRLFGLETMHKLGGRPAANPADSAR
jgi:hypothetical protein